MSEVIEIYDYKGHVIEIGYDHDPMSPVTDWSLSGIMLCSHGSYNLGNHQISEFMDDFIEAYERQPHSWADWTMFVQSRGARMVLPLYLYDHSGITISTTPFSCPWDSGQVGIIYTTDSHLEEMGCPKYDDAQLKEILVNEVDVYDRYLRGDVYCVQIKGSMCDESMGSHYGTVDEIKKEAEAEVDGAVERDKDEQIKIDRICSL